METLYALEQRITQLITLIKDLKAENNKLTQENKQLAKKLETIEETKMVVDDLIKNIDLIVKSEQPL